MKLNLQSMAGCLLACLLFFTACEGPEGLPGKDGKDGVDGEDGEDLTKDVVLKNHSVTPALIKKLPGFESLEVYSLISSEDKLINSLSYTFGGSADGAGLRKVNGGYAMVVNHEDNFAVSRILLDETFKPISGEYILNSDGGKWRLCSSSLATPEEHGFGPIYLTCGESNPESRTHALNPFADKAMASMSRELAGLGRWNAENAVPLPKTAYPGKTAILIGDDDSGTAGGQVALYLSNTVGDLENGSLYVLKRNDNEAREKQMTVGTTYPVQFVQIQNHTTLTGAQINAEATALSSIAFGRVEDVDYRKDGVGREIYFAVTGQNGNADRTKYGRVYKLVMDATNPLVGNLEVVLDGDVDTGIASEFQNPDNIVVTQNFAYVQEDSNTYGEGGETHDAYIYQYDLSTKGLKKVFEMNHFRNDPTYASVFMANETKGNWEYGAMVDVSNIIGEENTFILCIQPHTWRTSAFQGVDGGSLRTSENQGSQVVVIKGLPK